MRKLINSQLLDTITEKAKESQRLRMNHNLHNSLEDNVQQLLNALEPGTKIPIHRHLHTCETYLLLRGKIKVFLHNEKGQIEESLILSAVTTKEQSLNTDKKINGRENYGLNIPAGQWHSLEVLESGTIILEVKEGPYKPLDQKDILELPSR
ncbi:MAG: WbuC family cupin fold metalloprotein [Bacteroidales bacterium]